MRPGLDLPRPCERQDFDHAAPLLARVALDRGEAAMFRGLLDGDADGKGAPAEVRRRIAQQLKRVERPVLGVAAVRLVPLPRWDRQHVGSDARRDPHRDRKSTRLNSSHLVISYAVFCLKKKKKTIDTSELSSDR